METFLGWGNSLNKAYERWRETQTRPIRRDLHPNAQTLAEIITPEQIALGAGDDYLLQLNSFFATHGLPAYIRPLGEPNRCLNAWSGVNATAPKKAANTAPSGTRRPSGGSSRSSAAGRRWKGSTRRWPKSACRRSTGPKGTRRRSCRRRRSASSGARCRPARRASRATSPATTGRGAAGSTGSAPTSTPNIRSGRTSTASTRRAVAEQAGGDHRVGGAGKRRTALRQAAGHLDRHPQARPDAHLLPGLRPRQHVRPGLYPRTANTLRKKIRRANFLPYAEYNAGLLPPCPRSRRSRKETEAPVTPVPTPPVETTPPVPTPPVETPPVETPPVETP